MFFYYRGEAGTSWSVRDYSAGAPTVRYANQFGLLAEDVIERAEHAIPALSGQFFDIRDARRQHTDVPLE